MDPLLRLAIRLSRTLRRRPGRAKVAAVCAALAAALAIGAVEKLGWWPEGWKGDEAARRPRVQPL